MFNPYLANLSLPQIGIPITWIVASNKAGLFDIISKETLNVTLNEGANNHMVSFTHHGSTMSSKYPNPYSWQEDIWASTPNYFPSRDRYLIINVVGNISALGINLKSIDNYCVVKVFEGI